MNVTILEISSIYFVFNDFNCWSFNFPWLDSITIIHRVECNRYLSQHVFFLEHRFFFSKFIIMFSFSSLSWDDLSNNNSIYLLTTKTKSKTIKDSKMWFSFFQQIYYSNLIITLTRNMSWDMKIKTLILIQFWPKYSSRCLFKHRKIVFNMFYYSILLNHKVCPHNHCHVSHRIETLSV